MGKVIWLDRNNNGGEPNDNNLLRLHATPEQFRMVGNRVKACEGLTGRQREVFHLVGEGLSTKAIGRRLNIAPGTVKVHLAAVYSRFGTCNRVHLAAILEGRQAPAHWVQNKRAGDYQAGL